MSDELEFDIVEDSPSISIVEKGEFYMVYKIDLTMTTDPEDFLFSDFSAQGIPDTISGAVIPGRPEAGVERPVIVIACSNTGFTLALGKGGAGELPLIVALLMLGG